jgi:hypothetical protein
MATSLQGKKKITRKVVSSANSTPSMIQKPTSMATRFAASTVRMRSDAKAAIGATSSIAMVDAART